jgi:hypothetical protein
MTNSTEQYTAAASQVREATERGVEVFKKGAQSFADQASAVSSLPKVDLTAPVARYFDYIQKSVDLNRELATKWAELFSSLSGSYREQAETVGRIVAEQSEAVSELAVQQAEKADELAREKAEQVEQAKRDEEKAAKAAERDEAKKAKEQAREPYAGLTKAELSDLLVERDLPKTGNIEDLIERLVSADSK